MFELDPRLRQHIQNETQAKIEAVQAELAWESEKHTIALQKLKDKFFSQLVHEHISLSAFKTNIKVNSFRRPELPQFLKQIVEIVNKKLDVEERNPQDLETSTTNLNNPNNFNSTNNATALASKTPATPGNIYIYIYIHKS